MYDAVNDIGCIAYINAIDKDCECVHDRWILVVVVIINN